MNSANWQKIKEFFNATIDLPDGERANLLQNCEAGIRVEVEKLLAAHSKADGFIAEPAMVEIGFTEDDQVDAFVGQRIDSYEILREIGRGGMGTVYLAKHADESFDKKVAVKLINRGMDTTAVLKRFMIERSILARLEHNFIARLIDGGTTADGLPYFVMEYVEGEPITKFCNSRNLSIEERLKIFQSVCSAISYAHQNLVVHRDLKPSNILITADGTPKLLDFGIAKLLNPDWSLNTAEATATMMRMLTPEYASPEQLRGLNITTASDVYSLGVVLYELLCGERPYKISSRFPEEIAREILTQEPVKPSSVASSKFKLQNTKSEADTVVISGRLTDDAKPKTNPQSAIRNSQLLRGDLDNIVLQSLQKEPERRYASVQELSEDIRRHLAGLPVTATADNVSYRLAKFVKRHKVGVFAAALIVLTLLIATAVTTRQSVVAMRERDKAEQRFTQVRKLAKTVLFEYHDGIENLAGATPMREKMVKDALEYLDNLSAESGTDADLQRELAAAYQKVADVQGAPSRANLGNYKGALESYKKALAIREKLNAHAGANPQTKLELIQSYSSVGELSQTTGNIPAALENYSKAFAVFDSLPQDNTATKHALANLYQRYAKALAPSGKLNEALENFKKSINMLNELISANPDNPVLKRDLAYANIYFGDALVTAGDLKEALAAERAAYALLESLISPTNAQSRREANVANARIARVLSRMGDKKGALEIELKALAIDEELVKADPSNALARRDVYIDYFKVAMAQMAVGDLKSAIANQRKAAALCEAEIALNPLSSEMRGDLAAFYFWLGGMLEKAGEMQEALQSYKKVLTVQEALANEDTTNAHQRGNLSEILTKVSDMSLKFGDKAEALTGYQKALTIREELVAANPENADGRGQLALIYQGLGEYFTVTAANEKRADGWREAKNWFQKSLDVWRDLQEKGKLAPEDAGKLDEIPRKIADCETALARL